MLDKDLTNVDEAQGMPQYVDGTDPNEDIDEAALMYVIGYDASKEGADESTDDAYASDIKSLGEEPSPNDGGDQAPSWRETVQTDDASQFKRARMRERNMRAMSNLWNRIFPIDYDALPLAEYVAAEEDERTTGMPGIPTLSPGDAEGTRPGDGMSVAGGAVVAGLGLGLGGLVGDVVGTIATDDATRELTKSDTSNRDTVMIGNSALSDALADIAARHGSHWKDDGENASDEEPEEEAPQPDDALPENLESLYDEAIGMFTAIDDPSSTKGEDADAADADEHDDQFELEDGDVLFPDDGISVESDSVSEDYRGDTATSDIYESAEWKEIEQEIQESKEAVQTGLGQLDVLAGVSDGTRSTDTDASYDEPSTIDSDDTETVASEPSATDEEIDNEEPDGSVLEESHDYQDFEDDLEWDDEELPDGTPHDQGAPSDQDTLSYETDSEAEDNLLGTSEYRVEDASEEQAEDTSGDQTEDASEDQSASGTILQRIIGFFQRPSSEGAAVSTEPVEPQVQPDEKLSDNQGDELPDWQDEITAPDAVIHETAPEQATQPVTDSGEVWESLPEDAMIVEIGEDYRTVPESEDPNVTDELRNLDDDEIIQMKDDEPTSDDYRNESVTDLPTQPMPAEELVEQETSHVAVQEADAGMVSGTQRIRIDGRRQSSRVRGKARLRSLEIDASPELMLPLPTSRNGQVDANIKVKTSEFLNPKRTGGRSSHVRLSVRPSKVRPGTVSVLPAGAGYLPERSPIGSHLKEQGRYEYEPIRRIGEPISE